jgi:hypothetical protein
LKFGDFGVGRPTILPAGIDLNTFTTNGSYDVLDAVNKPAGTDRWGYLRVIRHFYNNGYCYQEWTELNGADKTYFRVQHLGNWGVWREIYHTGNILGTVSATGTYPNLAPTGAIIESGSNVNGEYVKYANGTMICFGVTPTMVPSTTGVRTETMPALFSIPPIVIITPGTGVERSVTAEGNDVVYSITTTSFVIASGRVTATTFQWIAIGRWK